ncbi:MAG: TIGR02996 domain-containing protein [Gemmataceae bacterium]|nr:TIGR02996 domain-containing protein [Gemmataceae bacterium]
MGHSAFPEFLGVTMSVLDALYQAILAAPADDTPRLVYADALEDAGQPERAAFVRGQVELARSAEWEPAWVRASYHDRPLISGSAWTLALPELADGIRWDQKPFRRGFPAAIQVRDIGAFVREADDLFAKYPIDSLELVGTRHQDVAVLERCRWLGQIARLDVPEGAGRPLVRRLLAVPGFEGVTDLQIGPTLSVEETAQAVLRSRLFPRLTALGYRDERGRVVAERLSRVAGPARLRTLDLSGNRLTADALAPLLPSPVMAGVETFDLSDNRLGPDGARELAAAQPPALRALRLLRTVPGDAGVGAMAGNGVLLGLRLLDLGGNNLGPGAAKALAAAPAVGGLRVLDLTHNRLGDAGAVSLARCPHLGEPLSLDLADNEVGDQGAVALAQSPNLAGLLALNLRMNPKIGPSARNRLLDRFGPRVLL